MAKDGLGCGGLRRARFMDGEIIMDGVTMIMDKCYVLRCLGDCCSIVERKF
jgi:hypothetical protein